MPHPDERDDAQLLFDATTAPRKITIVAGSADHGIDLLDKHPETRAALFGWLTEQL